MTTHKIKHGTNDMGGETIEIEAESQAEIEQLYNFLKKQEDSQ